MEPFLITKVEEILGISNRGLFFFPAFPKAGPTDRISDGDQIELGREDGFTLQSKVAGIEHFRGLDGRSSRALRLPPGAKESDTPVGTEIWWIAERSK